MKYTHSSHILSALLVGVGVGIVAKPSNPIWQIVGGLIIMGGVVYAVLSDIKLDEDEKESAENIVNEINKETKK